MFNFFNRFPAQFTRWSIAGLIVPITALNLWVLFKAFQYAQPLVSILISAALLAFLLNFPVQFLQKRGIDRNYAVAGVVLLTLGLLVGASITVVPQAIEELGEFVSTFPNWIQATNQKVQMFQGWATQHHLPIHLNQWTDQFAQQLPNRVQAVGNDALNLLFGALGKVSNLALTGIFTVYLLSDGKQIWNSIFQRLPGQKTSRIQRSMEQHFQDYFTGQAIIAALTITLLAVVFLVLGIPFPLLLGLFIGTLSIVPFGGLLASSTSALLIATDDPRLSLWLLGASIVTNQTMDQLISPRLMGNLVGLRPFWVLLAILVGAKLSGLVGLLIAVPIASILKDAIEGFSDPSSSDENAPASQLVQPEVN
ncbi:AI-2E family transporter [Leptolyngbya sp. AN03gr2]|uniref:AI-2E family transporter n=1 Tax=unclassified Leptolyngbya TaxID=2650499 RepID=UPI003D320372